MGIGGLMVTAQISSVVETLNASSNYSFLYSSKGMASILAGGLAAQLFEKTGSWAIVFYGSAVLALLAALMAGDSW